MLYAAHYAPSVPGRLEVHYQGSGDDDRKSEGTKNPRVKPGYQIKLNIATYNAKTLKTKERVIGLEEEIRDKRWDIIGICEIRRNKERCTQRSQGRFSIIHQA